MKKLIAILVLGLLWCNIGYAYSYRSTAIHMQTQKTFLGKGNSKNESDFKALQKCRKYYPSSRSMCKVRDSIQEAEPSEPKLEDSKIIAAASGSGFFVSRNGHIVTNYHVIEDCNAVKVSYKGDEINAKILAVDKSNDLAIIKAKINPSKAYPVSRQDVTLLQDIVIAGFPLGKKVSAAIKANPGNVTSLAGYNDNFSNFQTNADINKGNSGGPIVDTKGNIVGVAVATWSEKGVQGIHFGIKSSTLVTFANSNGVQFMSPNSRDMSNLDLGKLITEATVFLECHMTVAKIKKLLAKAENRKAFYSDLK